MSYLAKTKGRLSIRKAAYHLHLWLGLLSGLVVFIVGLTGAVYVFEPEIRDATESWRMVEPSSSPYIKPSVLRDRSEKALGGLAARVIEYPGENRAAIAAQWNRDSYNLVYLNPYTGEVLKVKDMKKDFLRKVIEGHTSLWIPRYGRLIVSSATLVFVVLLISGLILWWPRNASRKAWKNAFTLKRKAGVSRRIYDLHNVLGFYSLLVALVIAMSGLVWGFQWFSNGVYALTSGGKAQPDWWSRPPVAKSAAAFENDPVDAIWTRYEKSIRADHAFASLSFIQEADDVISLTVSPDISTGRKAFVQHFNPYRLQVLPGHSLSELRWEKAGIAERIRKANYDIHTGRIGGLPGRILAFFGSLIAASLPVTGFLMWKRKRKKRQ